MSKAVLISIKPYWCSLIATGNKTVEVRKSIPKLDAPFKCYIYCTKTSKGWFFMHAPDVRIDGKVMGEFICDNIEVGVALFDDREKSCMSKAKLNAYANGKPLYGWHISNLKIYDKPKELSEFRMPEMPLGFRYEDDTIKRPPQSWQYVEECE